MALPEHHDAFATVLFEVGADDDQSRLHGIVSGYLAGGGDVSDADSLASVCRELARDADRYGFAREDALEVLGYLLDCVASSLARDDFSYCAFLPGEDDAGLPLRLQAIADWCEGFLAGLYSGFDDDIELDEDITGIIGDLQTFAESLSADDADAEDSEGAEYDLFEIEEYLRMAAMFLYERLAPERRTADDDDA